MNKDRIKLGNTLSRTFLIIYSVTCITITLAGPASDGRTAALMLWIFAANAALFSLKDLDGIPYAILQALAFDGMHILSLPNSGVKYSVVLLAFVLFLFALPYQKISMIRTQAVIQALLLLICCTGLIPGHYFPVFSKREISAFLTCYLLFDIVGCFMTRLNLFQQRIQKEQADNLYDMIRLVMSRSDKIKSVTRYKTDFILQITTEIDKTMRTIKKESQAISEDSSSIQKDMYAGEISRQSSHLMDNIHDIQDFAMLDAGMSYMILQPYRTDSLLLPLGDILFPMVCRQDVTLKISMDKTLPSELLGDRDRITQILSNLLTNAVKFTEHGTVTASISGLNDPTSSSRILLRLAVKDTGQGMPPEALNHLNDAFVSGSAEHRWMQGSGMGTALIYKLVHLMSGTIDVQSSPGDGTTFIIDIPQNIVNRDPVGTISRDKLLGL